MSKRLSFSVLRSSVLRSFFVLSSSFIVLSSSGCSGLEGLRALVQPPRFEQATGRPSEIRLVNDGAAVRLWTRVSNPNAFSLTLGTLRATLSLEGSRAADIDFPFGLPLAARGEELVPIDISVKFRDLPGLGQTIARAISRQPIDYDLEGTIGVSTRGFEQTLGPMTFLRGQLR